MKVAAIPGRRASILAAAVVVSLSCAAPPARAQAPYLLPYTIGRLLGGGAATVAGQSCTGPNGTTGIAADTVGDGCLATSAKSSGTDLHDVAVDPQGNVYFIDNGSYGTVRRIDARTGIVTVYAGGPASGSATTLCTNAIDKYGDGCASNDFTFPVLATVNGTTGVTTYTYPYGNQIPGTSTGAGKFRGLGVARDGDLFIADYTDFLVHKVSAATGLYTILAGTVSGSTIKTTSGQSGFSGDGGLATSAKLSTTRGVAADAQGNVYIADSGNNVVREVLASNGNIVMFAGIDNSTSATPTAGFAGDGGPATSALLAGPEDVVVDASGNVFIGDFTNNRVRVVYEGGATVKNLIALTNSGLTAQVGYIYTIMGGGAGVYSGTATAPVQVPATSVPVGNPRKLTVDANDNVYLADSTYNVIWFLDATTGYMRIVAGQYTLATGGTYCTGKTDAYGDGCPASQATLSSSSALAVAVDANENLYVTDPGDSLIRKISTNQTFPATAQGASTAQTLDVHFAAGDSPAAANPYVVVGSTDFTVAPGACTTWTDTTVDCFITVTLTPTKPGPEFAQLKIASAKGLVSQFGLSGEALSPALTVDPGTATAFGSGWSAPGGVTQDGAGNTYVADTGNHRIVEYSAGGTTTVVAGTGAAGYSGDGAAATAAKLNAPKAVAVGRNGAIYIADTGNNVLRRIDPLTGFISTYGGAATACATAVDTLGDGCLATAARFSGPSGIAADVNGNLFVSDTGNNLIRQITPAGYVYTVGGGAAAVCAAGDTYGNGCLPTLATFNGPTGIQVDDYGNLYIADTGNNEIRKISANNFKVAVVAGTGQPGGSGNGGLATSAQVSGPTGVAVDAAGDVYIADTGNDAIRVVNSAGVISTVAGTLGTSGAGTLPGSAYNVLLNAPAGVFVAPAGTVYALDTGNNRALNLNRGALNYTFARTQPPALSSPLPITVSNSGSAALTLASPAPFYTATGNTADFTLTASTGSLGCTPGESLSAAAGNSCGLQGTFAAAGLGTFTATYTLAATSSFLGAPAPALTFNGVGALLTATSSVTAVTSATPQYAVPFTVQTKITPASCNTAAPSCYPTGTVAFEINGVTVATGAVTVVGGFAVASGTISGQSVGTTPIVAVYSGDLYYASSTAPTLNVTIALGSTVTTVSANPASSAQFAPLTLTATVASTSGAGIPTGSVNFFAGTAEIAANVPLSPTTGVATVTDASLSFGLVAGTYSLTAVYVPPATSGNYAASTSVGFSLTVTPDPQTFQFNYNATVTQAGAACPVTATVPGYNNGAPTGSQCEGTAQGSTAQDEMVVLPSNTLSGTMTFSCSGLPQYSVCTFQPTTLSFTPVSVVPTSQVLQVTLWTDVAPGTNPAGNGTALRPGPLSARRSPAALASLLGWPLLLLSLAGALGFRSRLRHARLLSAIAAVGLLAGSSLVMTGCFNKKASTNLTPTGVYNVTVTATAPNGVVKTLPIAFTVSTGIAGQE